MSRKRRKKNGKSKKEREHRTKPEKLRTGAAFERLVQTDKSNYIHSPRVIHTDE